MYFRLRYILMHFCTLEVTKHSGSFHLLYEVVRLQKRRNNRWKQSIKKWISLKKKKTEFQGIMNLSAQYFIIYTVLAVLRTMQAPGQQPSKLLVTVQAALATVAYVPML
jgi:hypothetical protein